MTDGWFLRYVVSMYFDFNKVKRGTNYLTRNKDYSNRTLFFDSDYSVAIDQHLFPSERWIAGNELSTT